MARFLYAAKDEPRRNSTIGCTNFGRHPRPAGGRYGRDPAAASKRGANASSNRLPSRRLRQAPRLASRPTAAAQASPVAEERPAWPRMVAEDEAAGGPMFCTQARHRPFRRLDNRQPGQALARGPRCDPPSLAELREYSEPPELVRHGHRQAMHHSSVGGTRHG